MNLQSEHAGTSPRWWAGRIPSLDGLRALSIALVIASHASGTRGFPPALAAVFHARDFGNLGVRIFFVISGFLITGLLMRERAETERISLGRFYLRRTFRIFPPFYAFVGAIAAATLVGWVVMPHSAFVSALTYTVNYPGAPWDLGHAWSLSVEEQFYVLWPPLLVLLGTRRGLKAAIAFIVAAPLIRLGYHWWLPSTHATMGSRFETVADAIATGCVLALARDRLWASRRYRALLESRWIALVPVAIALGILADPHPRVAYAVGITMKNVAIAILIDWCVRNPDGRVGRVLNARAVKFVGVLSYSLYVWQQPFFSPTARSIVTIFPLNVALAASCALASYYLLERPALRTRSRIERWLDARSVTAPAPAEGTVVQPALATGVEQG